MIKSLSQLSSCPNCKERAFDVCVLPGCTDYCKCKKCGTTWHLELNLTEVTTREDVRFVPCMKCGGLVKREAEKCTECHSTTGWPQPVDGDEMR